MKTIIVLSIACVLLATTAIGGAKALYEMAQENGKVIRDTVYIDLAMSKGIPEKWYQYQIEISDDSIYVFDAQRLVSILDARECGKLDSVLIKDNE